MDKFLKFFFILQEKENGNEKLFRYNPYNPLTYIIFFVFGIYWSLLIIIFIIDEIIKNGINKLFRWH